MGLEPFLGALPLSVMGSLKTYRASPLTIASQHLKAHLRGGGVRGVRGVRGGSGGEGGEGWGRGARGAGGG